MEKKPSSKWCYLLAPVAGLLAPFSLAPYNLWPLSIISLALLLVSLQHASAKQGLALGWLYGLGLYGAGASWVYHSIHDYGHAPAPLAAALTLLFVATLALAFTASFGYIFARYFGAKRWGNLLAFPALWVLFEWSRSWFLTGFPWLFSGYAHTDTALASLACVVGVYGISFIVALSASTLYRLLIELRKNKLSVSSLFYSALLIAPWLVALLLANVSWTQVQEQPINVTLVQPNITQDLKWQPEQRNKTLQLLYQQTASHLDSDIIIWPENAVPLLYHRAKPFLDDIAALASQSNTTVITGIPYWEINADEEQIYHNSITALGSGSGIYHKQKLVPFGEYVPLQQGLRGLIEFFNLPMSDFHPGPAEQTPLIANIGNRAITIAPYICYEIVYPDFVRASAQQSDLLLTISDDSWFGTSAGPLQHLQMARMRAIENGRYLIRVTNTGVTAIINHHGKIETQAAPFVEHSLTASVRVTLGHTPYSRWGSWPILLACLTLLILVWGRKDRLTE
jgi:apolipoprotein N-acyltransferase